MTIFAFVFARGGSKGLPGKNIMPLHGSPLLGHSIRTGQATPGVERIFVSTDSTEIADVARQFEAEVIWRPPELAADNASEWHAWQHAIRHVHGQGMPFDTFLSLPATSPLRSVDDVTRCLSTLDDQTDVVITVTPASRSPYFNMVTRGPDGASSIVNAGSGIVRRQDAPEVYDMTTVAYVARTDFILAHDRLFAGRVKSVVIPKERAVDIDDAIDFRIAEALYERPTDGI